MSEEIKLTKEDVDPKDLAQLFIERAEIEKSLIVNEALIEASVLALEDTQKIAGVTATYYKPSDVYDYEAAVKVFPGDIIVGGFDKRESIESYTTSRTVVSVAWKKVCEALEILESLKPIKTKPARVTIKVVS